MSTVDIASQENEQIMVMLRKTTGVAFEEEEYFTVSFYSLPNRAMFDQPSRFETFGEAHHFYIQACKKFFNITIPPLVFVTEITDSQDYKSVYDKWYKEVARHAVASEEVSLIRREMINDDDFKYFADEILAHIKYKTGWINALIRTSCRKIKAIQDAKIQTETYADSKDFGMF